MSAPECYLGDLVATLPSQVTSRTGDRGAAKSATGLPPLLGGDESEVNTLMVSISTGSEAGNLRCMEKPTELSLMRWKSSRSYTYPDMIAAAAHSAGITNIQRSLSLHRNRSTL